MKHGYPPIVVPVREKQQYFTSLQQWNKGDPAPFTSLMADLLHKSFDLYFSTLKV
jgi:hypothetical protein